MFSNGSTAINGLPGSGGAALILSVSALCSVRFDHAPFSPAAHARKLLIGLQHRKRLTIVDNDRPEILDLDVRGQVQPCRLFRFGHATGCRRHTVLGGLHENRRV